MYTVVLKNNNSSIKKYLASVHFLMPTVLGDENQNQSWSLLHSVDGLTREAPLIYV